MLKKDHYLSSHTHTDTHTLLFLNSNLSKTKINQCIFTEHMLRDLDKLQSPAPLINWECEDSLPYGFSEHTHANGKEMQMDTVGIIRLSALNRLPQGNQRPTTKKFTGICWSINSTITVSNVLNMGIHYVMEYLFCLLVDLHIER